MHGKSKKELYSRYFYRFKEIHSVNLIFNRNFCIIFNEGRKELGIDFYFETEN